MTDDHKHDRTYEVIDLDEPPSLASENDTHWIFFCPNCETKRGKPDDKGKMYFDKNEHKGFCHLCNTAFFPLVKLDEDDATGLDPRLNQIVADFAKSTIPVPFHDPSPMNFSFEDLKPHDMKYLKSRHRFLPLLAPLLGIKSWRGSKNGVVVPYLYKDYVATFQVRFDTTDQKARHFLPKGVEKIPYSPEHLLTHFDLGEDEDITIVEGWADAVAAWILGYPHPLALQGSTMTDYQVHIFRRLMPNNVFIIMDDYGKSEAVRNDLKRRIPSVAQTKIVNFGNDVDPEEYLKKQIEDPEKLRFYFNETIKLIKERTNQDLA